MYRSILVGFLSLILFATCRNKKKQKVAEKTSNNIAKMAETFPKPTVAIKTIGILLYDGYATLDAMGPYHVLSELMGVNVFFVGRHRGTIENSQGVKVQVDTAIDEVMQLDILVVPGGFKETYLATKDMQLLQWIRQIDSGSIYTTSVCTGAWILGATGLLKQKKATTHWYGKTILANEFGVLVQNERFVRDGKYWTSAGVTAGMDMSLAIVNEIAGKQYTKAAMLDLEYDPKPPFAGGSENNTDAEIISTMRQMYDGALETAIHPDKAFKNMQFQNTHDFICKMPLTGGIGDTAQYRGKLYGFCSAQCKAYFVKNAQTYVKR
jgi:putative intracellular protease/amidase/YHS domain-containing protein